VETREESEFNDLEDFDNWESMDDYSREILQKEILQKEAEQRIGKVRWRKRGKKRRRAGGGSAG
jgi:hypothetical protein